jgi:hypothetical protein
LIATLESFKSISNLIVHKKSSGKASSGGGGTIIPQLAICNEGASKAASRPGMGANEYVKKLNK